MLDPVITGYLAGVAINLTTSILGRLGKRVRQAIEDPPRQQALARYYQAALAAMLPQDDPTSATFRPMLEDFLAEQDVTTELAELVRGGEPGQATLADSFAEAAGGRELPPFDVPARLAAGVEAFVRVAEQEPELAPTMQIAQLRDATQSLRELATDVEAIRRAVELAQSSSGGVAAERDVTAGTIVTGTQINHIVQVYAAGGGTWAEADYRVALERYLEWLRANMGRVVFRGIKRGGQQAVELALHEVYVPLAAETLPEARDALKRRLGRWESGGQDDTASAEAELAAPAATERLTMQDLLRHGERLAVIGAPGCGKTTVLQHMAWTLAEALTTGKPELAAEALGLSGELPLPIYVPLSLYADHRRRFAEHADPRQRQLATFINHYLLERQAGLHLPDDFFATLLNQGRHIMLLLDGLDEVPNEDERALVSQAVRDLTSGREHVRLVVTSRTQAYQGKAVLGRDFRVVRVLPLEPEHVAALIRQAYRAIYPAAVERHERQRQADSLIASVTKLEEDRAARPGSMDDQRLVTTPLVVRMLLIVHFNLRRLPDQRAELYMEVVDTLLTSAYNPDEAVAQRLAQLGGDWRSRRDMLQCLAFHLHSRGAEAGREIGERELTEVWHTYLTQRLYKSPAIAEAFVADLVAVSRQRGGLLEEQGGLYRFSHLSFQEFLTARYLAEVERDIERMVAFLEAQGRVGDAWWREPVLLLGGYLQVSTPDTATVLVHRMARLSEAQPSRTARTLAAAELAATIFLEWGGAETTQQALARRLADLLTDAALPDATPPLRARAGRALTLLGDPRAGVGTRDELPDLVWCEVPAGPFQLGARDDDPQAHDREKPSHEVTLPTFYVARYPITNAQFARFVKDRGYHNQQGWTEAGWAWRNGAEPDLFSIDGEDLRKTRSDWLAERSPEWRYEPFFWPNDKVGLPQQPVVGVTWYEAMAYCAWLHQQFVSRGSTSAIGAESLETLLASGNWQLRLPTEAEWEKAAGWDPAAGRKRLYAWGDDWDDTKANVNFQTYFPSVVGIFPAGAAVCGALDMTGNVWEWTLSRLVDYLYQNDERNNPEGEAKSVLRGGSLEADQREARVSYRDGTRPDDFNVDIGFRVVLAPVLK